MGRKLRRVPMDFNWPINKQWEGFVNPHYEECSLCNGSGLTMAARRLEDIVGLLLLSGTDAQRGECHPYFSQMPLFHSAGKVCEPAMAELTTGLAGRPPSFIGHDLCDRWSAKKKIIAAAGLPENWGLCPKCKGEGVSPESQADYDAWEPTPPPKGEGYQIWETVSEGSPISPVFATPEELATHMATTQWGVDKGTSYEVWMKFILGPGWGPSFIADDSGVKSGVEAVVAARE